MLEFMFILLCVIFVAGVFFLANLPVILGIVLGAIFGIIITN